MNEIKFKIVSDVDERVESSSSDKSGVWKEKSCVFVKLSRPPCDDAVKNKTLLN